jgi:hypothetical protein
VRSNRVIAHLVYISIISGIEARVRLVILAHSSWQRAKGFSLFKRAYFLIGIRSRLSLHFNRSLRLLLIEANKPMAPLLIEAPLNPLE